MVGPKKNDWTVLRETDGERFFAYGSALIFSNISNDQLFVLTHSHVIIFASCDV